MMSAIPAISGVRTIIVWPVVLTWRWAAHHVILAIVHKVVIFALNWSALGPVRLEFLQARWRAARILLLLIVHRIAIRSVVLPSRIVVHVLALGNRSPVIV